MDRLVTELEGIWNSFAYDGDGQPTGVEWLPADHVGQALCTDLGYEDMPEFEDALKGALRLQGGWGMGDGRCWWGKRRPVGWAADAGGPARLLAIGAPLQARPGRGQPRHALSLTPWPPFPPRAAGPFEAFLDHLPHVIKDIRNGRCYFQIRPDPPQ
jgi:hypothetical protein